MRLRTKALGSAVAALATVVLATVARADLDIGIPPGTGQDWLRELPATLPNGAVRIPTVPAAEKTPTGGDGSTGARTAATLSRERIGTLTPDDIGATTVFEATRVLTVDIVGELDWVTRRPGSRLDKTHRGPFGDPEGAEVDAPYPPVVTNDLFWFGAAPYLRHLCHPNLVSDAESLHFLVVLGEPAHVAANSAELSPASPVRQKGDEGHQDYVSPKMRKWIDELRTLVRLEPVEPPRVLLGSTPEETMLLRFAAEELSSGFPYGFGDPIAPRLLALDPEEAVPLLARYAVPPAHLVHRRNACALLAGYTSDAATAALLAAAKDEDGTVRERALDALARRHEKRAVPTFQRVLAAGGMLGPSALCGLGVLGDASCAKTILKALAVPADADVLWCAIPACGRCRHDDPKAALEALARVAAFLEDPPKSFEDDASYNKLADEKGLHAACLAEMTTIARARLGDAAAQKELEAILRAPRQGVSPTAQGPLASPVLTGTLHAPSLVLLVESLPAMGEWGTKRLVGFAFDPASALQLRVLAMQELAEKKALDAESFERLAVDPSPPIRARALKLLAALDADRGRKAALRILEAGQSVASCDAIAAVRVLCETGKLDVALLLRIHRGALGAALAIKKQGFDPITGNGTVGIRSPVLEEVLEALGSSQDDGAMKALEEHLKNAGNPARGTAVAALGGFFPRSASLLVASLEDRDPWVRFVAWRVLHRNVPSLDAFADWIHGTPAEIAPAVKKWKGWLQGGMKAPADETKELVDRALSAYADKGKNAPAWDKARAALKASGKPAFVRLLEVAGDAERAEKAFAVLRAATGQLIPDDVTAWKAYLDGLK